MNQETNIFKSRMKSVIGWCFYDWANSAFPTVLLTFVFATYFTQSIAKNKIIGTAQWGDAVALAGLLIALLSPPLGAIADLEGRHKPWIAFFSILSIVSAGMLWFALPSPSYVHWALTWMVLGIIGLEVSMVFYNAMLRDLVPESYTGRVSGWGWGFGYFGGLLSLLIVLLVFIEGNPAWLGLSKTAAEHVRISGPFVALWFFIFALPLFFLTRDTPASKLGIRCSIHQGLYTLWHTLCSLKKHKEILKFLVARMIYIDGLNTIFAFGGIYAAGTFHMNTAQIIEFGIAMNVTAGLGAITFAWIDDLVGAKPTILLALIIMITAGTGMLTVQSQQLFWIFGLIFSIGVGPTQAASRSMMVHLAPKKLVTEMFGLYAFSGKATSFLGPWILATVTLLANSQRIGMATVIAFLLIGGTILLSIKQP